MKRFEQVNMNIAIENEVEKIVAEFYNGNKFGKPFRSCNAWVYETENYFILRSYNTIVAAIHKESKIMYDFLRAVYGYTATSAQHISKFRHDYTPYPWDYPVFTWRVV